MDINFITHDEVLFIIESLNYNILQNGLLMSAIDSPKHLNYYTGEKDIIKLAICYLYHLTKAHALNDGNKRLGSITMRLFLSKNGKDIDDNEENREKLIRLSRKVAASKSDKEDEVKQIVYDVLCKITKDI